MKRTSSGADASSVPRLRKNARPEDRKRRLGVSSTGRKKTVPSVTAGSLRAVPAEDIGETFPWKVWDASLLDQWEVAPLKWLVEGVIQSDSLGFLSGPPKVGKSLLALDLCDALSRGRKWLDTYKCKPANVLYIAREDPARRIRDRLREVRGSKVAGERGKLVFLIRERVDLTSSEDIDLIKQLIVEQSIALVVLDVVNRMIPDLDENEARDVGKLVDGMEELRETLGITVLAVDHTRKPSGKEVHASPFELKGSIAKYGACDFILCVARRRNGIELYFENKDTDRASLLLLAVSPQHSEPPKFGIVEELDPDASGRAQAGARNRDAVLAAIPGDEWVSRSYITQHTGLSASTAGAHLNRLLIDDRIEKVGSNRTTRYRRRPTDR